MDKLSETLEDVKKQMADPESPNPKETKMTATKKTPTKKTPAKKTNGASKAESKPAAETEGMVSLKKLCEKLKIDPRAARVKLRNAEIENPGRWAWKEGSGALTKVEKLLSVAE